MAKQKPAPGKKTPKSKAERPSAGKESKVARKRPAETSKPAAKAPVVATKKKSPAVATVKPSNAKAAAASAKKTPDKKAAPKAVAAVKTAPKQAVAKIAKLATKAAVTSKPSGPAKAVPQATAKRETAGKAAAVAPAAKKVAVLKPAKAPAPVVKPAPKQKVVVKAPTPARSSANGQVAGVLQAARSVASRATKVVEVEKERKSHLTAEELVEFRQILLDKRRELVDDMVNLEDEARRTGSEGNSGSSAMPIHMADLGSDTWEQEFTLNLIEKERSIVREIDEALDRIEKKTYGTCLATGKAISKARLRVKPWAKYCIEYARKRELGLT